MDNTIKEIKTKKIITTDHQVIFRTILDVISCLFTDENNISYLTGAYKISENQQVWFPNFVLESKKEIEIQNGYAIYPSPDREYIYQVDKNKGLEKREKLAIKQKDLQLAVFGKFFDKENGVGYHFLGVYLFDHFLDPNGDTMVYKRISKQLELK